MKKRSSVLLLACLLAVCSVNLQAQNTKRGWELDLKKASLDLSSTDVKNAEDYKNFPNAKLTSESQTLVTGHVDL